MTPLSSKLRGYNVRKLRSHVKSRRMVTGLRFVTRKLKKKKGKIQLLFNENFVNQCLLLALKNTLEHVNV